MIRSCNKKAGAKGKMEASLTVEASILIPFALLIIAGGINIGYDLFQEAGKVSQIHEELKQLDPVEIVRKNTLIGDIKK